MPELPTGTVTFMFTDIEGSTALLNALGERYTAVLERHHQLLREACIGNAGVEVGTEGDAFFVAFDNALAAIKAAIDAQRALHAERWPADGQVRVRMGLHTGQAVVGAENYVGMDVHRAARISAAAHGGQILTSDATRALTQHSLPAEVELRDMGRHRLKGLPAPEDLFQLVVNGLPADFPPIASLELRPNNLPAALTSFIGRERQIAEISERLESTRLVTLTGPGGTGKTRLSVRVAEELLPGFQHGCWFVELDALREPELVPATIAATLGVRVPPDKPAAEALTAWLADRQLLLILDNFEQLSGAAPLVTELLAAAPRLRVVVTSRTPLHVYGEQEYPVPPLASAAELREARDTTLESLTQYEAVQLFIERAVAVKPDFRVTNANAPAVAEICARLDGLPLAIELCAARAKLLTAEEMLARLEQNLSLLSSSVRDMPERQRTLRGAIDWSHDLLDQAGRRLFAGLAVFRGGFTHDAAQAVSAGDGSEIDTLDVLASLVDNSLLRSEQSEGTTRFAMLETIRQYAREKLALLPDADALLARHAGHYFEVARNAGDQLTGPDHARWLDVLEHERDNLRAAFARAAELGMVDEALQAAGAMWRFWQLRGQFAEGRAILERLLAEDGADPAARAVALTGAGGLAYWQADYGPMGEHYVEARQIYEALDDRPRLAEALYNEGYVYIVSGNFLGAVPSIERAAAVHLEVGNQLGLAETEFALGYIDFLEGNDAAGQSRIEAAIEIYRSAGALWLLADNLTAVGYMRGMAGDWEGAVAAMTESLEILEGMGSELGLAMVFEATASAVAWLGDSERAGRLFGKSDEIRNRLGGTPPTRLLIAEPYRQKLRADVGDEASERLLLEGRAISTAQGVELARGFRPPPDAPPFPKLKVTSQETA